jgi:putative RNA 2'-phosphotransferase
MNTKSISKFLSLILRHSPETVRLQLDAHGWVNVTTLLKQCAAHGRRFSLAELEEVVATNDKQRFAFNEEKTMIRANQGHSIEVSLDLPAATPPDFLYHGTVSKFMADIKAKGLLKMNRQHVHLTDDLNTADKVGSRRGIPQILTIRSGQMHQDGMLFYLSENGVWLTDEVPAKYIEFGRNV